MQSIVGKWRITEMELWNSDYFDMEVPAYIEIKADGSGEFQFGLVYGQMRGKVSKSGEDFSFRWNGSDEYDEAFGSGSLQLKDENSLEGCIEFYEGDESELVAERMINS